MPGVTIESPRPVPHFAALRARPRRPRTVAARIAMALAAALACFFGGWALWGIAAFARYGHAKVIAPAAGGDSILPRFIAAPEVVERQEAIVAASPRAAWAAAQRFDLQSSGLVRAIFVTRERMVGAGDAPPLPRRPFLDEIRSIGWGALAEAPGREIVFGAVTRPWEKQVVFRPIAPERFAAFDSAGYVKIAWTLAVDSLGPYRARVSTETRVATTDADSRARFRRYWATFSPGIALIRHEALRIVRRDAERGVR